MCIIKYSVRIKRSAKLLALLAVLVGTGCSDKEPVEKPKEGPTPVELKLPANLPAPVYQFSENPLTEEGIALGKRLFYDGQLSRDNLIACGSCHLQPTAFTHHGHDVSHGIDDKLGRRNSLPIQNLIWYNTFFWDGGVHNLELTPLSAIMNPVEMDEEPERIIAKLQLDQRYVNQFQAAFGTEEINSTRFLQALSQFLATMISANSRYDKYVRHEGEVLTADELDGMQLFARHCAACHATDLFTDQTFRNNGFSSSQDLERDKGREEITLNPDDRGKFKVPSLRNVALSAPYMHNGKLNTLEDVLDFYASGVHDSPTLDPLLKDNDQLGFALTEDEKKKLIAFLKTLTDHQFLTDKRFAEY